MTGYENDRRQTPYTNSKMFNPIVSWGLIAGLLANIVTGTAFAIRLEGDIASNSIEIQHVKELQQQENGHVKGALEDIKEEQSEIKRLLREVLKEQQTQ